MSTIQLKRGLVANLPASAAAGEPVYTTDDQQLHFGTGSAVVPLRIAAANVIGLSQNAEPVNAQTGTTYNLLATDAGKLVTFANAAAVAVTVPSAVFTSGQYSDFENNGPGDVTITPTSATINGAANFVMHTGQGIRMVFDGTNFQIVERALVALSKTGSQWLDSVGVDGTFTSSQPAFTDIGGTATAAQVPNLDAAKIATGQLAVACGGTGSDLSGTGGASQVLKQTSAGGAVTVAQLAFTDISGSLAAGQLPGVIDGGTF